MSRHLTSDGAQTRSGRASILILVTIMIGVLLTTGWAAARAHHRGRPHHTARQAQSQRHRHQARSRKTCRGSVRRATRHPRHRRHSGRRTDRSAAHRARRCRRELRRAGGRGLASIDTVSPTISIINPAAGTTVSGNVVVTGTATDDQGVVRSVHVQIDGKTPRSVTPSASWSYALDTTHLSVGPHQLAAFARDSKGNTGYTSIGIVVSSGPTPSPNPSPSPDPGPSPDPSPSPAPSPGTLPGPDPTGPGGGVFSINCDFDHRANDDPIVYFDRPGAAMLHDFFGSKGVGASTTPDQLRAPGTTCGLSADTASYWASSLEAPDGTVFQPSNILAYYRAPADSAIRAFPQGLKMIAGVGPNQPFDPNLFGFSCSDQGPYAPLPVNCDTGYLKLHVVFPSCWDGVNLDSPNHRSHMAYPIGAKCPADHPIKVVRLSLHVQYRGLRTGQGYQLVPGPDGMRPGPHADFMNGWDQATLEHLVAVCANAGQDVNGPCGQITDGVNI